jgi:hypothetical protein
MELGGDDAVQANFLACPATSDRYRPRFVSVDQNDKKLLSRDAKRATSWPAGGKSSAALSTFLWTIGASRGKNVPAMANELPRWASRPWHLGQPRIPVPCTDPHSALDRN